MSDTTNLTIQARTRRRPRDLHLFLSHVGWDAREERVLRYLSPIWEHARSARISLAVVRECMSALASFPNCRVKNQPLGHGELDGLFDHAHTAFGRWRDHHLTLNVSAVVTTSG